MKSHSSDKMTNKKTIDEICIHEKSSIRDTIKNINASGLGIALIVDNDKKLKGVVTDGDVRRAILQGKDLEGPTHEIMNRDPFTINHISDYESLADEVRKRSIIGKIPVIDSKRKVKDLVFVHDKGGSVFSLSTEKKKIQERIVKNILVIGGAGYIGSVLVRQLLDKGYKVTVLDTLLYGDEPIKELFDNPDFTFIKGNTRHVEDVVDAVKAVDAVVHLAELVGDPMCAHKPQITQEVNLFATHLVAMVCKHFHISKFVYMSSCSVYGASKKGELLNEQSRLNPVSLYAKMKIEAEKALFEMANDIFKPCIFRLSTVYGLSPRMRFDLVVNIMTAKAVKEGTIKVFGGDQYRPNVHVADVARAIILALEAPIEKVGGQVFNVGSEKQNYKIEEIAKIVQKGIHGSKITTEGSNVDLRDYKVNFEKIRSTLGFAPEMTIEKAVVEIKKALEDRSIAEYSDKRYHNFNYFKEMEGRE